MCNNLLYTHTFFKATILLYWAEGASLSNSPMHAGISP